MCFPLRIAELLLVVSKLFRSNLIYTFRESLIYSSSLHTNGASINYIFAFLGIYDPLPLGKKCRFRLKALLQKLLCNEVIIWLTLSPLKCPRGLWMSLTKMFTRKQINQDQLFCNLTIDMSSRDVNQLFTFYSKYIRNINTWLLGCRLINHLQTAKKILPIPLH